MFVRGGVGSIFYKPRPTLMGIFISILQLRKLSVRVVRLLAPGYTANKQRMIPKLVL